MSGTSGVGSGTPEFYCLTTGNAGFERQSPAGSGPRGTIMLAPPKSDYFPGKIRRVCHASQTENETYRKPRRFPYARGHLATIRDPILGGLEAKYILDISDLEAEISSAGSGTAMG